MFCLKSETCVVARGVSLWITFSWYNRLDSLVSLSYQRDIKYILGNIWSSLKPGFIAQILKVHYEHIVHLCANKNLWEWKPWYLLDLQRLPKFFLFEVLYSLGLLQDLTMFCTISCRVIKNKQKTLQKFIKNISFGIYPLEEEFLQLRDTQSDMQFPNILTIIEY